MTQHMTRDAVAIAEQAFKHAIHLGYPYLGGEHFLLALAAADQPVGVVLREHGVTPERVAAETARVGLLGDVDRDALATIGIDVDAVYAKAEASFGPKALALASRAAHREPRKRRLDPRRVSGTGQGGVFLPHDPGAHQGLVNAHHEAEIRHAPQIDVEHLALGFLAVTEGPAPSILSGLGVSGPALARRDHGPLPAGELTGSDGQPGPRGDRDVIPLSGKLPAQSDDPFRWGGGRLLIAIDSHEHGDPRETGPCPLDDVEMTGCDGSKVPG
jgi:hypothetical protein